MSRPVTTIGAMNRSASEGRSRRISAITRRTSARSRRRLMRPPPSRRRTAGTRPRGHRCPPRARSASPDAAGDHLPGPHEQQLVAAVRLVHDVARHDDRGARVGESPEVAPELDAQERVHADRRLVEEQHRRLVDERAGQRQPPALTAREGPGDGLGAIRELDQPQRLVHLRRVLHAVRRAEELGVLPRRQGRVDAVALRHVADPSEIGAVRHPDAQDVRRPLGGPRHPGQQPDQRGLARPVGPEQAVDAAWRQVERHAVHSGHGTEPLDEPDSADGGLAGVGHRGRDWTRIHHALNSTTRRKGAARRSHGTPKGLRPRCGQLRAPTPRAAPPRPASARRAPGSTRR